MLFSIAALMICWSRCGMQMVLNSLKFSEPLHHHYILRLLLPFQLQFRDSRQIRTKAGNGPNVLIYDVLTLWCYAAPSFLKLRSPSNLLHRCGTSTAINLKGLADPYVPCSLKFKEAPFGHIKIHPTLKTWAARSSEALVPIGHNALRHNPISPIF